MGTRALVCTGAHPDRYAETLSTLGLPYALSTVDGEPTVDVARNAVQTARRYGADVVVSIGGGSVFDLGKAVQLFRHLVDEKLVDGCHLDHL